MSLEATLLSLYGCQLVALAGRCPLALSAAGPRLRLAVEDSPEGYRGRGLTVRLGASGDGRLQRHMVHLDQGPDNGSDSAPTALAAAEWWLLRDCGAGLGLPLLHLTSNANDLRCLAAVLPLAVSLSLFGWQSTRLVLPLAPRLVALELRGCTCLCSVALAADWPGAAVSVRVLDMGETRLLSLAATAAAFPCLDRLLADGSHTGNDWADAAPHLRGLRELNATVTAIRDLSWLGLVEGLQVLRLHGCTDVADWSPIARLRQLRELNANHSSVARVDWIADCRNLETLSLYGCPAVTDGAAIGQLGFLQSLNIGWHGLSSLAWLAGCHDLRRLLAVGTGDTPDEGVRAIGELRRLEVLHMAHWGGADLSWLPRCTALRELYLAGCTGVADWAPLGVLWRAAPAMETVDLNESSVTGVQGWGAPLSAACVLSVKGTVLTAQDRSALAALGPRVTVILGGEAAR